MWWLLSVACAPPASPVTPDDPAAPRRVEFVLDPGYDEDGTWVSTQGTDQLVDPAPVESVRGAFTRFAAWVPPGPGTARVERPCGPAWVPFDAGGDEAIVLAYPRCAPPDDLPLPGGARLDRIEVTRAAAAAMRVVDPAFVVAEAGPGDLPAVWVSHGMARSWCAWNGGRLPRRAEWEAAVAAAPAPRVSDATRSELGPGPQPAPAGEGWVDLRGNVAEWLEDGSLAGGSWVSRADELGVTRVPPEARADTIGFRCARDTPGSLPPAAPPE